MNCDLASLQCSRTAKPAASQAPRVSSTVIESSLGAEVGPMAVLAPGGAADSARASTRSRPAAAVGIEESPAAPGVKHY